jgi:hypothetical protein
LPRMIVERMRAEQARTRAPAPPKTAL